jgi:hypothetical protein
MGTEVNLNVTVLPISAPYLLVKSHDNSTDKDRLTDE